MCLAQGPSVPRPRAHIASESVGTGPTSPTAPEARTSSAASQPPRASSPLCRCENLSRAVSPGECVYSGAVHLTYALRRWRVMLTRVTARADSRGAHRRDAFSACRCCQRSHWDRVGRVAECDDIFVLEVVEGVDARGAVAGRAYSRHSEGVGLLGRGSRAMRKCLQEGYGSKGDRTPWDPLKQLFHSMRAQSS